VPSEYTNRSSKTVIFINPHLAGILNLTVTSVYAELRSTDLHVVAAPMSELIRPFALK